MLTKREFELLVLLTEHKNSLTQRQIAEKLSCSVGAVNKIMKDFIFQKLYDGVEVTSKGYEALEPYKVKRAVFIAAGFGARLAPITLNTPKPLVRVNGVRIIDTLIDAVIKAGIKDIVIVRGYLGEQFDQLLYKYPNIRFIENPIFNESNNISSAMCVRYLFQNAYVLEADIVLRNSSLIRKYEYDSNILGVPVEVTDDWCVTTDKNGYILSETIGGKECYKMVGISHWTAEDGAKLAEDIKSVYEAPGGKERYWEETALVYKKEHYNVSVRECKDEDYTEIDTMNELKQIDKIYDI